MIVTFISQCEKNALKKTRRVLDAFADRIGDNAWQTVITAEGLQAVRKLLRKTASKSTAVSCHQIKTRNRTELIWVVGKKSAFDLDGRVPVNSTQVNRTLRDDASDWLYLPLIQALSALAALLHDWGKANKQFQQKLLDTSGKPVGDALRHEYLSCLLLRKLLSENESGTDLKWLEQLASGQLSNVKALSNQDEKPLGELPITAQLISWLIISHHRLPYLKEFSGSSASALSDVLDCIDQEWGYANPQAHTTLNDCLTFEHGVLSESTKWLKEVKRWARKLIELQPLVQQAEKDGVIRLLLHHCRLSLMLADHCYSSKQVSGPWSGQKQLIANTQSKKKPGGKGFCNSNIPNQYLDQHLLGVCEQAKKNTRLFPVIEKHGLTSHDTAALKKRSSGAFGWQDKAVEQIKAWQKSEADSRQQGFFAVNMASTGCGKTFANAKVMRCLSTDGDSLRFILALGLRTLTLQTGDEYREKIFSDNNDGSDLAVLIGSKAMKELHEQKNSAGQSERRPEDGSLEEESGSESAETLLDTTDQVVYDGEIPEEGLSTLLLTPKDLAFFHAPVLACTIDHLMAAVTTKRGGRYILPSLRLMSSDLVIDEIDDFTGNDSIAIGRLIHLAGMLGRKVMISSATIPPAMAEGYFKAYQLGWQQYARMRNKSTKVGCAWIDEFKTQVASHYATDLHLLLGNYRASHQKFVDARVKNLAKEPAKRRVEIVPCKSLLSEGETRKNQGYQQIIIDTAMALHRRHGWSNGAGKLTISFGVVRMANINPALSLTRYLLDCPVASDCAIRVMPYHSQQVLLLRSAQESHLDQVLKRKESPGESPKALTNRIIQRHIADAEKQGCHHLMFILVATPVEEVGRDHDFDWAVIEPSSYRSLVQMAGRVRRHRTSAVEQPNIAVLQYNWKALKDGDRKGQCYFLRPGYETGQSAEIAGKKRPLKLAEHDMSNLIAVPNVAKQFNAAVRINASDSGSRLAMLEHAAIAADLCSTDSGRPDTLHGFLSHHWYLTGFCQYRVPFRLSEPGIALYLVQQESEASFFIEKDVTGKPLRLENGELSNQERIHKIERVVLTPQQSSRLWLQRSYDDLITQQAELRNISLLWASLRYGEILPRESEGTWLYNDQLGMFKEI